MSKSKRTKALEIPAKVKRKVFERDGKACVWCGSREGQPNAHFIPRSHGGLGIEENILTLCWNCHMMYDQTDNRKDMCRFFKMYLGRKYPDWDETKLVYKKWR